MAATKRRPEPKLTEGYYTREEAAALLRLAPTTFAEDYGRYFTDVRPLDKRGRGVERKYLRAEVNVAATEGFPALAEFRHRMGRRN